MGEILLISSRPLKELHLTRLSYVQARDHIIKALEITIVDTYIPSEHESLR